MASSFTFKPLFFIVTLLSIATFCCKSDDGVEHDPAQIVAKALLCFNNEVVYTKCAESYRLTQSGNLNVPPEAADEYCSGACLAETHLVLNCIENILTNFLFYNKATVKDIRDTLKAGCSYTHERGNFDVVSHMESSNAESSMTHSLLMINAFYVFVLMIVGWYFIF